MKALVLDCETTGFTEPEIIEVAWLEVESPRNLEVLSEFQQRFKPSKPIDLGAMATHHIMDEDLVSEPPSSTLALPSDLGYLIGHNVDYDWQAAGSPEVKRICTLALCRSLFPDIDSHSQSAMIYYFERESARSFLKEAHSAMADVENCLIVLAHLVAMLPEVKTWEDLWLASEAARIPKVIQFGKHKGTKIADIPIDYKRWLLKQDDVDPYLRIALEAL